MIKTDLVMESCEILKESNVDLTKFSGVISNEYIDNTCQVTLVKILDNEGAVKIGKPIGEYFTIDITDKSTANAVFCVKNVLETLLKSNSKVLVAGIGNKNITPDALGPLVIDSTVVTRHLLANDFFKHLNEVSAISTNVLGKTGVETAIVVKSVCNEVSPTSVIAIDALAARSPSRLGNVIQISNTGLVPGSGIGNSRLAIDSKNLGTLVIAIGVPTVITGTTLAYSISKTADISAYEDIIVTPKEIDTIVKKTAHIISNAINQTLNPSLDAEDIEMFLE